MKISACLITKNEEKNLPTCLNSINSIVSEIIVVDTGSTDRTIEIANSYGAKVYHFDWVMDFAAARNYAISKAKSDWIIFLDADEYFAPDCTYYITGAIKEAESKKLDMVICMMSNIEKSTGKILSSTSHIRIFRNHPQIRYVGAIHERIVRLDRPAQALDAQQDITIIHTGYSQEVLKEKNKGSRNLQILLQELKKKPQSSDLLFYISESYLVNKEFQKALRYAKESNQYRNSELKGIYQKNYVNMFQCMLHLSVDKDIVHDAILKAIDEFPDYPDFHFFLGDYYKRVSRYRDAILAYETGLEAINQRSYGQSSAIATATKVLNTVGYLYGKTKQWEKCVQYHVKALQVDKYIYSSLVNVIEVLGRFEHPDAIYGFVLKLYDRNSKQDCLYLIKAALDANFAEISRRLLEILPPQLQALQESEVLYQFLIGEYHYSAKGFQELYQRTKNDRHAYGAIASAWIAGDTQMGQTIKKEYNDHPHLPVLVSNMLETSTSIDIDKKIMFSFFQYIISNLHIFQFNRLVGLAKKFGLLLETADMLYYQGHYEDAYLFYNEYLEVIRDISEDLLADLSYKVGDCLLQTGHIEEALLFLEKAQRLAPKDYRIIEAYLQIAAKGIHRSKVNEALKAAIKYYPDSISLRTSYQETHSI